MSLRRKKKMRLSDKIFDVDPYQKAYFEEDVKEFIKKLKEELEKRNKTFIELYGFDGKFSSVVDELAGEKLI